MLEIITDPVVYWWTAVCFAVGFIVYFHMEGERDSTGDFVAVLLGVFWPATALIAVVWLIVKLLSPAWRNW